MSSRIVALVALLAAHGALGSAAVESSPTIAVLPVARGSSLPEMSSRVHETLRARLAERATVVDAERTRAVLRRMRLRAPERAGSEALARLAGELGATLLAGAAVHDAPEGAVPELTLSARLYDGASGAVVRVAFVGRGGIDRGRWLALGELGDHESLIAAAVDELLAELGVPWAPQPPSRRAASSVRAAVVPFTATVREHGLEVAGAGTESLRAQLVARGVELAEPGCVQAGLERQSAAAWGQLAGEARRAIVDGCAAPLLLTGSVERWESVGRAGRPEPIVAVALRLVEGASGRILWAGSLERAGWDRPGAFGLRRIHSRGVLLERITATLADEMLASGAGTNLTEGRR